MEPLDPATSTTGEGLPEPEIDHTPDNESGEPASDPEPDFLDDGPGEPVPDPPVQEEAQEHEELGEPASELKSCADAGSLRGVGSLPSATRRDPMTTPSGTTPLTPQSITDVLTGAHRSRKQSGSADATWSLTWPWTCVQVPLAVPHRSAMNATEPGAKKCPWPSVCAADTGRASCTWLRQPAWMDSTPCAETTRDWKPTRKRTSPTFKTIGDTGARDPCRLVHALNRLEGRLFLTLYELRVNNCAYSAVTKNRNCSDNRQNAWRNHSVSFDQKLFCLGYRPTGWQQASCRIGEARKPGPSICSVNPGGWSRVEGTLGLQHDIVAVQETFLLREQVSSAPFTADKQGYYSSFTLARKTGGRPSGGLALLCRQAQPLQRMEQGIHWELGRWTHHLLPFQGGLHVFNVYGYSFDKERAPELNREVCLEIFSAVAALGNRQIFMLGDWTFVPDNFPIDLLNGGQVNRPLSEVRYTSPVGELQIDWILCSKALLPACGVEQETGKKPDHVAISLEFRLELVSQGYRGQKSYETAAHTTEQEVEVEYEKARQAHLARWSTALASQDVDDLWELWCLASETALGLPANSRGRLLLGNQQLLEKVPDEEAVATARQHDTVVTLKQKLLDTGACTFFEWPQFLGEIPPICEAQLTSLEAWITGRKKRIQAERSASWKAYVEEMWETSPKKIYKWIRGTAS
eukprot:4403169-Amphidinium_carterae.2